jgi:hypothetical protein
VDGENGLEEIVEQFGLDGEVGCLQERQVERYLSGQLPHLVVFVAHELEFLLFHPPPHLLQLVEVVAQQRKLQLSS